MAEVEADHPWFRDRTTTVLLGVGRLHPQKNFSTLLREFSLVRRDLPARLVILKDGQKMPKPKVLSAELGIAGDVSMPGFVRDHHAYMRRVSVFVLTFDRKAFGNVIAEALAVGTPVVSTDCPVGPTEILETLAVPLAVETLPLLHRRWRGSIWSSVSTSS